MRQVAALVTVVLVGLTPHARLHAQGQTPPPLGRPPAQAGGASIPLVEYKIGPRDMLTISVYKEDLFPEKLYPVLADGTLFFYPTASLTAVKVAGLTAQEVQEVIKKGLMKDGVLTAPAVQVEVSAFRSQQVTVTGEVHKLGTVLLTADKMTLFDALQKAGGPTTDAGPEIQIRRAKNIGEKGTLNPDDPQLLGATLETKSFSIEDINSGRIEAPALQDGDFIYVPKAEKLTVGGEVGSPGSITLLPGMTVIEAIRKAGGAKPATAAMNRLGIKRYDPTKATFVEVKNVTEATLVQANDVVTVPKKRIG
jgi:polysaccharide export outer membrane protein